jgi:hypothetical protein
VRQIGHVSELYEDARSEKQNAVLCVVRISSFLPLFVSLVSSLFHLSPLPLHISFFLLLHSFVPFVGFFFVFVISFPSL